MATSFTIKHRDEFEAMEGSGDATWRLARKTLEESAFGFNLVEIAPGGQIPEHDEAGSGHHELYVVPRGGGDASASAARTIPRPLAPSPPSNRRSAARSSTAPRRPSRRS
ncbi:MAG TPA: hypothetical protein VGB06_04090 [Solirubrobacterales bacterium]|jgi:hypothetical protein